MSVLVIDRTPEYRDVAVELVKWVDRRHRVETAADGATAWETAFSLRPDLVLCEPELPDISGQLLCTQLRNHLNKTLFIAYTANLSSLECFDGRLNKPPSRLDMLPLIKQAKQYKLSRDNQRQAGAPRRGTTRMLRREQLFKPVCITVALVEEKKLAFSVAVPEGASIGKVLQQLGKASVTWFSLSRSGSELDAQLHTTIMAGDVLLLRQ